MALRVTSRFTLKLKIGTCRPHSTTEAVNDRERVIFSGIQPTGVLHIGNYFRAVENWVKLQNDAEYRKMLISVVDLHALTIFRPKVHLQSNIRQMLACLLACGLDPRKVVIFQQSAIPHQTLLYWIISTFASLPQLHGMPTFKEKSVQLKRGGAPLALFSYPVLQAADILLYQTSHVPVGDDQLIHLNFARKLASNFNSKYETNFFQLPSILSTSLNRVKSLRNPDAKMSKSDENAKSRIDLNDTDDQIIEKCKKALTDSTSRVTFDPESRPGVSNLINIHCAVLGIETPKAIEQLADGLTTAQYKIRLAEDLIRKFSPMRNLYERYLDETGYLEKVLKEGNERAAELAEHCLNHIRNIVGLKM